MISSISGWNPSRVCSSQQVILSLISSYLSETFIAISLSDNEPISSFNSSVNESAASSIALRIFSSN